MEKSYKNIAFFFILILLFVLWGFYKSYFSLFPSFTGITTMQHFHGAMMLAWFALLIVQPFLIRYQKYELHKKLGKLSYVLVPFLLLSLFLVAKFSFNRMVSIRPREQGIAGLALNIPPLFAFATLYTLAIINKKNTAYHMRYIIGTSLLLIAPGIGRVFIFYGGMSFVQAVTYAMYVTETFIVTLIVYDIIKANPLKPYLITLGIILTMHFIWHSQLTSWWQAFGGKFADLFY